MPLPKGQKDFKNNPFNVNCINKGHSMVSASQAAKMEEAWDCAINAAIAVVHKRRHASSDHTIAKPVAAIKRDLRKLLSWQQRNS